MPDETFRDFLGDVKNRLFSGESATVLDPESPPNWERLGWKTGWIVEESHTGLQWWLTEEREWETLSDPFGRSKRQKNQAFSRWYGSLLETYRSRLGVPLKLETVRWRQMDLAAFEGRPLIQEEDWWSIGFEGAGGAEWALIVSERFIRVFEESEDSPEPEPPWTFLELWKQLDRGKKRELLECAGTDHGLLNHLSALVLSGSLELESLLEAMHRQPTEELRNVHRQRRKKLDDLTTGQERQTLNQWKTDALKFLTRQVGEWLKEGELSGSSWSEFRNDWIEYREDVLEGTFDDGAWIELWKNFHDRDLERIVPRLRRETLAISLQGLGSDLRSVFEEALPERQVTMIFDEARSTDDRMAVLKARESTYNQLRETIEKINYELKGKLQLGL